MFHRHRNLRIALQLATLLGCLTGMTMLSGCDDSGTSQVAATTSEDPNSCNYYGMTLSGDVGAHCCSNGQALQSAPADCPAPPGLTPITTAQQQVSDAGGTGATANQVSTTLASDSRPANGQGSVMSLAASAGQNRGPAAANLSSNRSTPSALGGANTNALDPNAGSVTSAGTSGSSMGGSSGGLGGTDSVRTSAAGDGSGTGAAGGDGSGSGAGAGKGGLQALAEAGYSSGGGGGSGAGGGGFGSGNGGGRDEASVQGARMGVGEDSFGSGDGADGSKLDPSGSADPDNYFELSHSSENIFKIVERRYTKKATQWATPGGASGTVASGAAGAGAAGAAKK